MKITNFLQNCKTFFSGGRPAGFSDFLINASPEEKKQVFKEAAEKANEEQRRTFKKAENRI
jgi:hypothetical protein